MCLSGKYAVDRLRVCRIFARPAAVALQMLKDRYLLFGHNRMFYSSREC